MEHGRALHNGDRVSLTIHKDDQDWAIIKGIQGSGYCSLVVDNYDKKFKIYSQKYSMINDPKLRGVIESSRLWEIKVNWFRIIDNSVSFGHKEEFNF